MRISGQSTLQNRLFLLCTILIVFTATVTSSTFLYLNTKNRQQEAKERINNAFTIILDDLLRQQQTIPLKFDVFLEQDNIIQQAVYAYNQNPKKAASHLYISGHLIRTLNELKKFSENLSLAKLSLYTSDDRLLAFYKQENENIVLGAHVISQSNADTFLSLSSRAEQSQILYGIQPIPDVSLPQTVSATFRPEYEEFTASYAKPYARGKQVGIEIISPIYYLDTFQGVLVGEIEYSNELVSYYASLSGSEVNLFAGRELSVGTMSSQQYLPEFFFTTMPSCHDVLRATPIHISYEQINDTNFLQGGCVLEDNKGFIGAITISMSQQAVQEKLRSMLMVTIAVTGIAILLAFLFTLVITRNTIRFIKNLTQSTGSIAEGNLNQRIDRGQGGELGTLATSFAQMRDAIKDKISDLERITTIMESTSDLIAIAALDDAIYYMNQAGRKLTGLPTEDSLTGNKISSMYPEEVLSEIYEQALLHAKEHGIWAGESAIIDLHGNSIPVSQVIMAHHDEKGELEYYSTIIRDIRQQKNDEKELKRREEFLRTTLNSIGDGVIVTDAKGIITVMNPVSEKLTGWSIEEGVGKPLTEVFHIVSSHDRERLDSPVQKVINTNNIVELGEHTLLIAKDKKEYQIADSAAPIRDNRGDIQGVILVFRDETEKQLRERKLVQAQKMEAVGTLAGGLAHDFNNVLSGIFAPISLIEHKIAANKPIPPEKLSSHLGIMRHSTERATHMVKQLLTISHRLDSAFTEVDLNQSIKHVLKIAENTFDKSIKLKPVLYPKAAMILADPSQIEQVLLNLSINASHAMTIMRDKDEKWGGELEITMEKIYASEALIKNHPGMQEGSYFLVHIKDTGVGMDDEALSSIFTPFYTTKEKGVGSGLGLSMVYNITKQNKGFINVYSEVGIGSTFNLYFPATIEENTDQDNQKQELQNLPTGEGMILVIDDEEYLRTTASEMLEELGYQPLITDNGFEGLSLYETNKEKIIGVILDMVMPEISGKETFEKLKAQYPEIRVILVSGFKQDERVNEILDMGAKDFIQKPYDITGLAKAVHKNFMR